MEKPKLSSYFESRTPSAIRLAQIEFTKRKEKVNAINVAIGNVSLPMHPAMQKRMFNLNAKSSPFKEGIVKYTSTSGMKETRNAFLNILKASGFEIDNLNVQITNGGSQAMELAILGCCGPAGTNEKPLLLIDAAYTNYKALATRFGRRVISVERYLQENGKFTLPDMNEIKKIIKKYKPGAIVLIPYDNPTGQFYNHETMVEFAKICVENNMWIMSDEAYRELSYTGERVSSIWAVTEKEVPWITGRRISIESSSKVWNACGLRIGALVTDNKEFHEKSVAENTVSLCSNIIGQYIFGALANEKHDDLEKWFEKQRSYYKKLMTKLRTKLMGKMPGIIVSSPDAAIYSVVDVRNIAKKSFCAKEFVLYCAQKGKVIVNGKEMTLLVAPMEGFYNLDMDKNPGKTQMRIAYVAHPDEMDLVPELFCKLFEEFENNRN